MQGPCCWQHAAASRRRWRRPGSSLSRADASSTVLTDYTIVVGEEQAPFSYRLIYDPSAIDERMSYSLRARITMDGDLTSTERVDPFGAKPGEPVRVMVSRTQ